VTKLLLTTLGVAAIWCGVCCTAAAQTLEGFAKLPPDTFATGPTSGNLALAANGRVPPFVDQQPVQGVSSVLPGRRGEYWVMPDNGFGAKENSPDFLLRVYRIDPHFKTKSGGSGKIDVKTFITLHDPDRKIPFPIVADATTYPGSAIPVDPDIRQKRLLTGGDLDIESVRVARDGTLWFGDEFGPFLLHTSEHGRVLDAPFPLPGVKSPQNPSLGSGTANLSRSKGFEGMAIDCRATTLYPMLEGPLTADPDQQRLTIYAFNTKTGRYTSRKWLYRMEAIGYSIGDLTRVGERTFLVIERDNNEGAAALFKKIFLVDFDEVDGAGFLVKRQIADLLNIKDPNRLGGPTSIFRFPFQTIEAVIPLDRHRLGVLNDNNYPFSAGRMPGEPDPDEFIIIKLDKPLPSVGCRDNDRREKHDDD
jgi:hypothetical protein